MATFTITATQNIDELTAKTGGDTYNVNGGTLNIDQDSRVGINQSTASTLGVITLSASLGGTVNISGLNVWMIPYTGGSGNVPAFNTAITNNGATGKLIGVHSALTAASTATGAAMPATGFIRVKQKTGTYAAGALTGIAATASDAGRIGWIEVVGDEAGVVNANRLGVFNITGAWYEVGTTNGTSNQTMQIPNNGLLRYVAGVFIEKTVGSASYEFYPNAGLATTTGTEASRGKCVWIDANGLVRIGNSGAATNGFTPITGLKVVVGNVFLENCTTAARTANVIPNATLATRFDFNASGGGVINLDKCTMAWFLSCSQAYSVIVTNSSFVDSILLSEVATSMTFTNVGVGNKPTTALIAPPLAISLCFAGGTFTDCVFQRIPTTANSTTSLTIADIDGFTFTNCKTIYAALRAHTGPTSITATRMNNCTFNDLVMIDGSFTLSTCTNVVINNFNYINSVSATTLTTNPVSAINLFSSCLNVTFSGITFPLVNNHPYTSLFAINTAGCTNIKIRNIGTRTVPLNLGSVNNCGVVYSIAAGAAANNIRIQRVYTSNTRSGIMTADNSTTNVVMENVFGDYADSADVSAALNMTQRGLGTTKALTAQTSVYGTHWVDYFTSATAGRIAVLMNEPTSLTTSQVALSNGAAFTSVGGLYMPVIGHSVVFTMPEYIIGHTAFQNSALIMAGGTATNYNYNFAIDINNGTGFSTMTVANYTPTTLMTALNALAGINAGLGFKLKIQVTTTVTNATAITSIYLLTTSTAVAQDFQYPLDVNTLTISNLVSTSDVIIYQAGTTTILASVDGGGTTFNYTYSGANTIDIGVFLPGYIPYFIRSLPITTSNSTLPVNQVIDRAYLT